ncbi:MAG: hypothetical protein IJR04_07455 [Bacteroidales bacterium]|nr:hypothetical protein [Bacteroidales bacterium]
MKRKIRTCAMMAILSLSMAGCQKDNLMFDKTDVNSNIPMRYSVSGTVYTTFLSDESELDSFIDRVFAIVNDGYTVTIIGNGQRSIKEKKEITFTTTIESESKAWAASMTLLGYSVQVNYNKSTGVYTCIATL